LLGAGSVALAACREADAYFGRTNPPAGQHLVVLIGAEPATLDPGKSTDLWEGYIIHAMFEGLTTFHPNIAQPMAGLATHYEVTPDGLHYTFYLRGHPQPRGERLPDTSTLRDEYRSGALAEDYARGSVAPSARRPARWSDGSKITAHDFVYSWRRALDPRTGATYAYLMYYIRGAEEVNTGKPPESLAVRPSGDFGLEVELRHPTPFLLQLVSHRLFCPVPRGIVEVSRANGRESAWTEPGRIITTGAFCLREWRSNERVMLTRNPHYYESGIVTLETLSFLPVVDGATQVNLYRSGEASELQTELPQLMPTLARKKDFRPHCSYGTIFPLINVTKPPFQDVRARYALNMATDKRALVNFAGASRSPALSVVPAGAGYDSPSSLPVLIDGKEFDVLAYDPRGARELFSRAVGPAKDPVRVRYLFPNLPECGPRAEIFQDQWRRTLGIELTLVEQELQTWLQTIFSKDYQGVADWGDMGGYLDPAWFLDQFTSTSAANGTGWADPQYDAMLARAALVSDPAQRMTQLRACENRLLTGMPFLPLWNWVSPYLKKPFVKCFGDNMLDLHQFKYAWIDTNWRPA
jgi:ABC-type oligopeptide transport system substrate-binding subunit